MIRLNGKESYTLMIKITKENIENVLGMCVPKFVEDRLKTEELRYQDISDKEFEKYIIDVLNVLFNPLKKSGKHRLEEWETGWNENLQNFIINKNPKLLIPKYHGKNKYVRWMGKIINPLVDNFDYKIHINFVDTIISNFLSGIKNVYEFGCGTGYHLLRLNEYRPDLNLYGLDWTEASQNTIKQINNNFNKNINYHKFNFYSPDDNFKILKSSMVYTVAALEQVGENFKEFINYLISEKPEICVHMEPISELLDDTKLIDVLSIEYFKKRNYLSGFLTYLKQLESEGKIEIIKQTRIHTGSYFIEGHSLVVWKPKTEEIL